MLRLRNYFFSPNSAFLKFSGPIKKIKYESIVVLIYSGIEVRELLDILASCDILDDRDGVDTVMSVVA